MKCMERISHLSMAIHEIQHLVAKNEDGPPASANISANVSVPGGLD